MTFSLWARPAGSNAIPDALDPAWPNASNTGPQAGTVFTPFTGEFNTTADGQIIQNMEINGLITVRHSNITVRDCIIHCEGFYGITDIIGTFTNLTVLRTRFLGNGEQACVATNIENVEVGFCDMSGMQNGLFIGQGSYVHDNYIHDLESSAVDPHFDGIQGVGGFTEARIIHNTVICYDTSCIILQNEGAGFSGVLIERNKLLKDPAGGLAHGILCQKKDEFPGLVSDITVINNRFTSEAIFAAYFHAVTDLVFTGNVYDDTGLPVAYSGDATEWSTLDGSINAPAGPSQYPTLLAGMVARPPWKVAGVDYAVGYPAGQVLKSPNTIAMAGVSVAGGVVTITGNNIELDGYDFTGFDVNLQGNNARFLRSKFVGGHAWFLPAGKSDVYMGYCIIDGAGINEGNLVGWNGSGNIVLEYNWFKNGAEDCIQAHALATDIVVHTVFRYNVIDDMGLEWALGAHGDWLQMTGGQQSFDIKFNLGYQHTGQDLGGFTQGFYLGGFTATSITAATIANNTMIARGNGSMNSFVATYGADITGIATVRDNYSDGSGAISAFAPGGAAGGPNDAFPQTIYVGNIDMVTGEMPNNDIQVVETASDSFNRADGPLGTAWGVDRLAQTIVSNAVKASTGTSCIQYRANEIYDNDQFCQVEVATVGTGFGPCVRHNKASPGSYYLAFFSTTDMKFYKVTAGAYTQQGSAVTVTIVVEDLLRLEVVGNVLTVKRNGASIFTFTDSTSPYTSGVPAIDIFTTAPAADNFLGGSL